MVQVTFSFLYKPPVLDLSSLRARTKLYIFLKPLQWLAQLPAKNSKYIPQEQVVKLFRRAAEIQMWNPNYHDSEMPNIICTHPKEKREDVFRNSWSRMVSKYGLLTLNLEATAGVTVTPQNRDAHLPPSGDLEAWTFPTPKDDCVIFKHLPGPESR